ncbi:MAG: hypothetical protein QF898_18440 [SAR202 cluster bacterium]|nr:hypothetical protein [SAR202 cluster bacterium]MDP6512075.1 hypothetical protein [SAR202 cluster bacterium]
MAGKLATLFGPLSADWRGIAAVATMSVTMMAVIGIAIGVAVQQS